MRPGAQHLTKEWQNLASGVNDLPLDSHGKMQIKFELTGTGEVWVDQVQLFDVLFPLPFYEHSQPERLELEKLRRSVESAEESNQMADCLQLLDGYWSRFLLAYTPAVQPMIAAKPSAPPLRVRNRPKVQATIHRPRASRTRIRARVEAISAERAEALIRRCSRQAPLRSIADLAR